MGVLDQDAVGSRSAPKRAEKTSEQIDWQSARSALDARGFARIPGLVSAREAEQLRRDFDTPELFRKHVDMDRHNFGSGSYRYFAAPLPPLVEKLRQTLYSPLATLANEWSARLGGAAPYPATLDVFGVQCAAAGQREPTPLMLRYSAGGYNRMHQDRYGEIVFPLQVVILLSQPAVGPRLVGGADFTGGQVLLSEHRPRMQTRVDAVPLELGEGLVFAASERPVPSVRGFARATMRHGVATVQEGERFTLGLIFHDAES